MRWILLVGILIMGLASKSQVITLEGNYCGKDIYIQNPFDGTGNGFCVDSVLLNGKRTPDEIHASAFVISLAHLQEGDKVILQIYHKGDCRPKVLHTDPCPSKGVEFYDLKIEEKK